MFLINYYFCFLFLVFSIKIAGNGALATNILQVIIENKGVSWSIGGSATWREFLTVFQVFLIDSFDLFFSCCIGLIIILIDFSLFI